VAVTGIEFVSLCEHHVLPFIGTASIGYLPGARVVGLSKLGRLVDVYARRLQVQERLTQEIAQAIVDVLRPQGVAVVLRAAHSCMSCRGVRKQSQMITSAMSGLFRENAELRAEFLALERGNA
jgi:GTP cyclohydrolase I